MRGIYGSDKIVFVSSRLYSTGRNQDHEYEQRTTGDDLHVVLWLFFHSLRSAYRLLCFVCSAAAYRLAAVMMLGSRVSKKGLASSSSPRREGKVGCSFARSASTCW